MLPTLYKLFQKARLFVASNCWPISLNLVVYLFQLLPQFFVSNSIRNELWEKYFTFSVLNLISFRVECFDEHIFGPNFQFRRIVKIPCLWSTAYFGLCDEIWFVFMFVYRTNQAERVLNGEKKQQETNLSIYINGILFLLLLSLVLLKA